MWWPAFGGGCLCGFRGYQIMKAALFLFALLTCSCARQVWTKAGASDADFQQDLAVATYNAKLAPVNSFNSYSSPFLDSNQQLGESIAHGVQQGLAERRLINMYLQMKGWSLTKRPSPAKSQKHSVQSSGSTQYFKQSNEEGPNEEVGEIAEH